MKKIFRYDYNNKLFVITFSVSFIFLFLSIITFNHPIAFVLLTICTILSFSNSLLIIRTQGIRINTKTNNIIIIDQLFVRKVHIKDIRFVKVKQLSKEKRSKWHGFFCEFFYPHTYMSHCDYVYNQGKVFNICFHMRDGTVIESYFGWLYREKEKKVKKVEGELIAFIENINLLSKEFRKNK